MKRFALIVFIIILIALILFKVFNVYELCLKQIYPNIYAEIVERCSKKYNIEKEWIFSLIKSESNFDKKVVSPSGAKGLMQLMENTAKEIASEIRIRRNRFV